MRWRRWLAAAAVGALALGSWVGLRGGTELFVTRGDQEAAAPDDDPEVVVTAPQLAGDRWLCPRPFPVKAYADGEFFPREHPGAPSLSRRPEACYGDPDRARAAGYELGPPPPGVEVAGGLYLVPVLTPARDACRDLSAEVGFTVPCPRRLPWPANGSTCLPDTCTYAGGVLIEQRGFPVPDGWCTGCDAHVVIVAMPADDHPPETVGCGPDGPGLLTNEGALEFVNCPKGRPWLPRIGGDPHADHTLTGWRSEMVVYAISVEGHGPRQREFLTALVSSLDGVPEGR